MFNFKDCLTFTNAERSGYRKRFRRLPCNVSEKVKDMKPKEDNDRGLRYNEGKLRFDLVNPFAHERMVEVMTKGADKYAVRNWEKGMPWTSVVASLKRHLNEFEKGVDVDPESGCLHIDHIACNVHFLSAYYDLYPEGDDRPYKTKDK